MLLVLGCLGGLAAGLLTGGSLANLAALRFRWPVLVLAALAVKEAGVFSPLARTSQASLVYLVSLLALTAWTFWHRDQLPALAVVAAGMALNLAVAVANGGHVPVAPALATLGPRQLVEHGHLGQYVLAGSGTRLNWLGDWIAVPGPARRALPFAYSPGDMIALVGIIMSGFQATRPRKPEEA